MQVSCPNCGTPIASENINIQRMAAVCPTCNTVFQFDLSDTKTKRRKVKQPSFITIEESGSQIDIAFRTNFRLDKNQDFISVSIISVLFTFITAMLITGNSIKPESPLVALGFGLVTLALYYYLALMAYNKTHIQISDEALKVFRKPFPNPLAARNTISLSGISHIRYEETAASKTQDYDTPRYHVWAEMVDGDHKLIVTDVIEDYAVFISQQLNELLDLGTPADKSNPLEQELEAENQPIPAASIVAKAKSRS